MKRKMRTKGNNNEVRYNMETKMYKKNKKREEISLLKVTLES